MEEIWYVTVPVRGKMNADSIALGVYELLDEHPRLSDAVDKATRRPLNEAVTVQQKLLAS